MFLTSVTGEGVETMAASARETTHAKTCYWIVLMSLGAGASLGQQAAAPQTARQALLEMFFSKTPGTFMKHLPVATRTALEKSGAMASLQQYSLFTAQLQTQQSNLQTFDTGSVLLSGQDPKTGQKVEITVEKDSLRGDDDDIVLSFAIYKDGKVQHTSYMPRSEEHTSELQSRENLVCRL